MSTYILLVDSNIIIITVTVRVVEELRKGKTKAVWATEWQETDRLLQFHGKIYIPPDQDFHH